MSDTPALDALDAVGEDAILDLVADGATIGTLGKRFGVSRRSFYNWINAVEGRRGRLEDAKRQAAEALIEEADKILDDADPVTISVAKERANQRRFKAGKLDRDTWGEKPATVNLGVNFGSLHLDALRQAGSASLPVLEAKELTDGS